MISPHSRQHHSYRLNFNQCGWLALVFLKIVFLSKYNKQFFLILRTSKIPPLVSPYCRSCYAEMGMSLDELESSCGMSRDKLSPAINYLLQDSTILDVTVHVFSGGGGAKLLYEIVSPPLTLYPPLIH